MGVMPVASLIARCGLVLDCPARQAGCMIDFWGVIQSLFADYAKPGISGKTT